MAEEYDIANRPFTLTCPECGGAVFPPDGAPIPRYVCHVGHTLTWAAMAEAQLVRLEFALCAALTQMKERAELYAARLLTWRAATLKELLTAGWSAISAERA